MRHESKACVGKKFDTNKWIFEIFEFSESKFDYGAHSRELDHDWRLHIDYAQHNGTLIYLLAEPRKRCCTLGRLCAYGAHMKPAAFAAHCMHRSIGNTNVVLDCPWNAVLVPKRGPEDKSPKSQHPRQQAIFLQFAIFFQFFFSIFFSQFFVSILEFVVGH